MSEFFLKLSQTIISNQNYHQLKQLLFSSYVSEMIGDQEKMEKIALKKLVDSAQIFYKSDDIEFQKEGALILAMILDLYADEYPGIVPIASNLFASTGDFPNIKLLEKRHPDIKYQLSIHNEALNDYRKDINTVEAMDFTLTDFQRVLWEYLVTEKDVITSAPTSAGKTHIILNYLLDRVGNSEGAFAAIVVPTRALITEVAGKLYELLKQQNRANDIEICTVPKDGAFRSKTFFVMTQERLHEVLLRGDVRFNYLFIDEAQNITDDSRGVLLHITIEKVLEDSNPQIIISMPSDSYQNSFSTIFKGIDFKKEITRQSPVAKILMTVLPKGMNLEVSLLDQDCSVSFKKGFKGTKFADIVYKLGKNESNIIYRNKTDHCENIADEIAKIIKRETPDFLPGPSLEEAADYVEQFVHHEYSLANNLRNGVAFHYGPLPSSIRVMVENLVKDGQINFVACTSTLAEGVNLPAKNLFLNNPMQFIPFEPWERLEDVKLNNITGRAGRMLQHFSGNVFLIEPDDWRYKDYFDEKEEKEDKIPTYFKSLNEELDKVLSALSGTYSHTENDQYKHYSIANKLLREYANETIGKTIDAEDLTLDQVHRDLLVKTVQEAHTNIQISRFTLESNPTIGYIQQNRLFQFLRELKNYDTWTLPHPKSTKLHDSLLAICYKLSEFGIYAPKKGNTIEYICVIAKSWIKGDSLKEIISAQIRWNIEHGVTDSINTAIRNVITAINSDIRFRLTNALRCYQLLLNNALAEKGLELSNVKLHSFLEVGACDERVIDLINLGASREAAIEIDELLDPAIAVKTYSDIVELLNSNALDEIHNITRKELVNLLKH